MPYSLRKGLTLGLPKTHSFYYKCSSFSWFYHIYLNLKIILDILEILIPDI